MFFYPVDLGVASPGASPKLSQINKPNVATSPKKHSEEKRFGIRNTPPVIYTGRRGRPSKVRPGQDDPHSQEREEIAQKFSNSSAKIVIQTDKSATDPSTKGVEDTYTTFDQVIKLLAFHKRRHQLGGYGGFPKDDIT